MDFTRLNLKTYRLDEGVATGNNAIEGENKASTNSLENSNPKQMDPRRREAQLNQRTARVGTPTTTQSIVSSYDYFADLRDKKQALNMFENSKCDWRKEIQEAANPDDDPNHPYVEIMPSTSYKAKEAEQNIKKGAVKQKMAGSGPGRAGLDEELLIEDELQEAIPALVGIAAKGAGALAGGAVKGAAATAGLATKGVKGAITKAAVGHASKKASEKAETKVNDLMSSDTERAVEEEMTFDDVWAIIEDIELVDEGLSGNRYKKALKKGKMYSRMVSADPDKRATRGGRGGESDFGAGDRGAGNKAARRAGTYSEYNEETSPGDYQDTPGKIKSGKILNTKPGVDNFDRTATPKENIARRKVNKNPEIRGKMGKKLVKQVETDAFSDK